MQKTNEVLYIGKRYGDTRLTIKGFTRRMMSNRNRLIAICDCDCGKECEVQFDNVKSGNATSCGCYHYERICTDKLTHGETQTRLYKIWQGITARCRGTAKNRPDSYINKGVTVCAEWITPGAGYEAFKKWALSNGYADNLTIDRRDNDGNYTPDNCRWATSEIQSRNRGKRKDNSSGYPGINFRKSNGKWRVRITASGKRINIGERDTLEEAIAARKAAEIKYWGTDV